MKLPNSLRALAHRNFRLFLMGQGTSQIGNWVQLVATSWLVFSLSGSPWMLGLSAFCLQIPLLVITPFAGVLIDRLDVRRVLYATNTLAMLQSLVMLTLIAAGQIQAWHVVLGNLVLGIGNAFDAPSRQALIARLLPNRQELTNAIALNATVMNGARFIGPMLGGLVTATFGEIWSFVMNCLMRFAVLAALQMTQIGAHVRKESGAGLLGQLRAGLTYAYGFFPTRCALLLLAISSVCLQSSSSLMPWNSALYTLTAATFGAPRVLADKISMRGYRWSAATADGARVEDFRAVPLVEDAVAAGADAAVDAPAPRRAACSARAASSAVRPRSASVRAVASAWR